jgi:diadenosine tetraphosphate (Ap4A) HIT family hydrolase
MEDFSEGRIIKNCPHCDPHSFALKHPLQDSKNFRIVCDVHPLIEGHILIIPKSHLSCVGVFNDVLFKEFKRLYQKVSKFLKKEYGSVSSFEHGKLGQTVFHSHVHLYPFKSKVKAIIPEGKEKLTPIKNLSDLKKIFQKQRGYLFLSIQDKLWIIDPSLISPRFFRDRFAKALGHPDRGNWKKMHFDKKLMSQANREIENLKTRWQEFSKEA